MQLSDVFFFSPLRLWTTQELKLGYPFNQFYFVIKLCYINKCMCKLSGSYIIPMYFTVAIQFNILKGYEALVQWSAKPRFCFLKTS